MRPVNNRKLVLSQKEFTEFQNTLPKIYEKTFAQAKYLSSPDITNRIKKIIEYYTLERFQLQGQLTVFAYHALEDPKNITDDLTYQINTIAWCVEMIKDVLAIITAVGCPLLEIQSYYLILDDIEDEANTRNAKLCWHLLPDVGSLVFNDTSILRSFIYEILRHNLKEDVYNKISKLFNEMCLRSEYGQYLDAIIAKNRNYSKLNLKLYTEVSDNKFTFYSVKFPILIALLMANKANKESMQNVDNAMKNIGCWIQMHNDIMDSCEELTTGKTNIDIKKGKPSWLAATALEICNARQREIFLSKYGSDKPEDVKSISELYEELGLRNIFCQDHHARLCVIAKQIHNLPHDSIPGRKFFYDFIKKIYPFVVFLPEALHFDRNNPKTNWLDK
ncbi:uncharacterized protein [Battus philenor]|uniref:uncharacterized protein isoform X2 n=1 Tax=Battus philenor TaxID=42288 RepID=UPI0035CFCB33